MRLINTKTLKLEEFNGTDIPPYAILSHTWGEGEVSFQDIQRPNAFEMKEDLSQPSAIPRHEKIGFSKIASCCREAKSDGFSYAWVGTCCIDKTSSSELSEAINSMYRWYQEADVCYVYLSDVPHAPDDEAILGDQFAKSRWFTRGWTLQELIAPSSLIFYNASWNELGTKSSLQQLITDITAIPAAVICGQKLENLSVAQRMAWASKRQITRIEDLAYCLLGIFDINMPMLYGEGERAFIRLQEEIIKNFGDHSIFAWKTIADDPSIQGLLAPHPSLFAESAGIVPSKGSAAFANTSVRGVKLTLDTQRESVSYGRMHGVYVAYLDCHLMGESRQLAIKLEEDPLVPGQYARINTNYLSTISLMKEQSFRESARIRREIYVKQKEVGKAPKYYHRCIIDFGVGPQSGDHPKIFDPRKSTYYGMFNLVDVCPHSWWQDPKNGLIECECEDGIAGVLRFAISDSDGNPGPGFVLLLAEKENALSATIEVADGVLPWNTLERKHAIIRTTVHSRSEVGDDFDRIKWQHPVKQWWVVLNIRRQIIFQKRSFLVHVNWEMTEQKRILVLR